MNIRETFALPRCPETAIHLAEGDWMYRTETNPARQQALLAEGWVRCRIPTLFKFTIWEIVR